MTSVFEDLNTRSTTEGGLFEISLQKRENGTIVVVVWDFSLGFATVRDICEVGVLYVLDLLVSEKVREREDPERVRAFLRAWVNCIPARSKSVEDVDTSLSVLWGVTRYKDRHLGNTVLRTKAQTVEEFEEAIIRRSR